MIIAPGNDPASPLMEDETLGNLQAWKRDGRLNEELLKSLIRLTKRIATARTYDEIFNVGADEVSRYYDIDRFALAFHDPENQTAQTQFVRSRSDIVYSGDRTPHSDVD